MSCICKVIDGVKAAFLMVMVQVAYAVCTILYKLVEKNNGMSLCVLLAYRYIFASIFMVPLAYFAERKNKPKITAKVLFQAFLCGLFGATLQQNLYVEAVILSGVTYATVMYNFIPGATFILAVCFGLERLNIRTLTGKAKVIGTLMGISGAMILTFYKSTEIHLWSTNVNLLKHHLQPQNVSSNNIWGSSLALGTCLSYSIWLIIQARMSEKFPWHYTSTALMSVMASIQSIIFALCMERDDWNQWKLGWDIKLFTALFAGVVVSGINWILISWCVRIKGPLYASVFNPLFLVLVAIGGSLLLDEKLYLGSVIGSVIIVIGLYIVLWGKSKELKKVIEQNQVKESVEIQPMEIITTKLEDAKNIETDNNDIKSSGFKEITIKNYET
ncbi:WAT1-related protein At1g25270-like [Vicia villosa]|uniref:WAT1-related protein At1g25270-like n=1 Tax=Vicia villosa TaxID=3911 RepID=UPI00273BEFFB|nr:WAT1-related protein At1g25270-like [Vicia villosa]